MKESAFRIILSIIFVAFFTVLYGESAKHRVIVLTDIENEPDDEQSLVRFLIYSNHYDVEGIIATTSTHLRTETREARIKEIVRAYGKVRDNLNVHEPGFPTEIYLQSVIKAGIPKYGMEGVGSGMDSEGSEWIIKVVDRDDTRFVWISVWGGTNTLAQALWKVRNTRKPEEVKEFISKNGLHVPERPDFGGWGGRYELYTPHFSPYLRYDYEVPETRPIWTDASDGVAGPKGEVYFSNHATIWRWREAYQNDFAARMDWCIKPYKEANHPPVARIKGDNEVTLRVGESITFDASESVDPDGDPLRFQWIHYPEAGNFFHWRGVGGLVMENKNSAKMTLQIHPEVEVSELNTTHIILQVTDTGTPALTRYQRVIVNILP